uniref:RING-type domain-containing protein n=1 Tax=Salarias fasciatus TaxID=181472 RepID=A0A672HJR1_SALFA
MIMEMLAENKQEDSAECPVCFGSFTGTEVSLDCGHSFCLDCLLKIVTYGSSGEDKGRVVCPVCRQLTVTKILQRGINNTPINATPICSSTSDGNYSLEFRS